MNPMNMLQLKERFETFRREHPKFLAFLGAVRSQALEPGTVLEMKIVSPDGRELVSNIRMTENDVEVFKLLTE